MTFTHPSPSDARSEMYGTDAGMLHFLDVERHKEYNGFHSMNQGVQGKCITNKAYQPGQLFFPKGAALGGTRTHDTLLSRQSALPTELPGQLAGRALSLQYNTTQGKVKPQHCAMTQIAQT